MQEKNMTHFRRMTLGITAFFTLIVSMVPLSEPIKPRGGIKVDQEVFDLLNVPNIQFAPREVDVFKQCQNDDTGLFFFITPIMTYLEANSGRQSVTRFFKPEQLDQAIRLKLKKQGTPMEMFCRHLISETEKVKRGEYTYGDILDHILECKKVCGPTMSAMASVYMYNSAKYYQGLTRFNYDNATLFDQLHGDFSQGFLIIDNVQELERVYLKWLESQRTMIIGLDARASQPGGQLYNDELSRERLIAVEKWFTEIKDVPESMIDRKWLGNYGPFIDKPVADIYNINSIYDRYLKNYQAPKSIIDGTDVYYGINQSVAMFLYRDVDIHADVELGSLFLDSIVPGRSD